jgi:hypothetical protein
MIPYNPSSLTTTQNILAPSLISIISKKIFKKKGFYITSQKHFLVIWCLANITLSRKGKGKAIPLKALAGPEGSRRLRLPDFKTIVK